MFKTKKWTLVSALTGAVVVLAIAGVWLFGGSGTVSAAENLEAITQASAVPGLLGDGYLQHRGGPGFPGFKGSEIDYQQLLADALDITVEDLEAAYETARDAAIDVAVEEGLLTQEQADNMKVWGGMGRRGAFGRTPQGMAGGEIDENALLADALGISVEDLQAARDTANEAAIAQAIEEGRITQEQADEMQANKALHESLMRYIDRNTLLAKALGMTVEDLQAALDEGTTLSDLMSEKGLDAATVRDNLAAAHAEALAQAVEEGVITQEQADEMQDFGGRGMMPGGMPDRIPGGMPRGRMMPGGRTPWGQQGDDTDGTRFRFPNRAPAVEGSDA